MKLALQASLDVANRCTKEGIAISIVEGGIWHNPGFEARLDAIWHSKFDVMPEKVAANNEDAIQFIRDFDDAYDTAIISTFGNKK